MGLPDSEKIDFGFLKPNVLGLEAYTMGESFSSLVSAKVNSGTSRKQRKLLNDWTLDLFN